MTERPVGRGRLAAVLGLCAFAYLYVFPYYPALNNPNENTRYYMTAAIAEFGTYQLDELWSRWGRQEDAALRGGHHYSVKAPGTSLLGVPAYWLYARVFARGAVDRTTGLWVVRVTASILPTLLFLFFLYRWLARRSEHAVARDGVFVSIALGSSIYGYSLLFVSHTMSALSAFGAFMILYEARHRGSLSHRLAFLAGLLVAGVTFFEYPGLIASLCLSLYALIAVRPWRRLTSFTVGGLIPTGLMMHFQWKAFGSPFSPGHLYLENPSYRAGHEEGFYGASTFHWNGLASLLFDLRIGLLVMTPIFFFAVVGLYRLLASRRERLDALVAAALVGLTTLVICLMNNWSGGWAVGPRYLVVTIPFVGWMALEGLAPFVRRFGLLTAMVIVGATIAGLFASGIPSAYYPHLPASLNRPLDQFLFPIIEHGFHPTNLGSVLGLPAGLSMLPMVLVGVGVIVWVVTGERESWRRRGRVLLGGALVAGLILFPHFVEFRKDGEGAGRFVAWMTRYWYPVGQDDASLLEQRIAAGEAGPEDYLELAGIYHDLHREADAERALERGVDQVTGRALSRRAPSRARPSGRPGG